MAKDNAPSKGRNAGTTQTDTPFKVAGFPSPGKPGKPGKPGDPCIPCIPWIPCIPKEPVGLGEYVFATNPYHAVLPPKGIWSLPYPPPVLTFKKKDCEKDWGWESVLYALDSTGIEHHNKPGDWKFKYAEHYVGRALRIPYMYYTKSERMEDDEGGKDDKKDDDEKIISLVLVRDYFLIGFEGGAGY